MKKRTQRENKEEKMKKRKDKERQKKMLTINSNKPGTFRTDLHKITEK